MRVKNLLLFGSLKEVKSDFVDVLLSLAISYKFVVDVALT